MATPYNGTTYKRRPTKDWVGSFFTARTDHEPGSFFCYDTSSSHTLCALVEKRMGRPYWMCCAVRHWMPSAFQSKAIASGIPWA